ncbi:MAG: COG1361 S-layer family protein [Halolamina sp.]
MRRSAIVLVLVTLLVAPLPATALDTPNFQTSVPEPELAPGASQELTVLLSNDAADPDESADRAGDVEVTVKDAGPIDVSSGPRKLGSMGDGATRELTVGVTVAADAEAGTYRVPLEVSYVDDGSDPQTTTVYATVRVNDRARFEVERVSAEAPVGQRGTLTLNVTNVGSETASAAAVTVASQSPDVTFGRSSSTTRFVGSWAPGESKTVTVETTVSDTAENRSYSLQATVSYEDEQGRERQSRPLRFGMTPDAEQTFALREVSTTLEVGEEGTVTGRVVNTGQRRAENVVVQFVTENPNVDPIETEVAVGDLAPGEAAEFSLDMAIASAAEAGDRLFSFRVRYRNAADDVAVTDAKDARVSVAAESDAFDAAAVDAEFTTGESGTLAVEITNTRDGPLRDISAKLYADAPLSSGDDEAFVSELGPGETATVEFGLSVGGDARPKTYPAEVDFQYETADGESRISDTYKLPVAVSDGDGGGLPLTLVGGVGALGALGGGAAYAYRRR